MARGHNQYLGDGKADGTSGVKLCSNNYMSDEKFVEDSRKNIEFNDDQIYDMIKILTSDKITPEKLGVDVVQFMKEYETRIEENKKQKLRHCMSVKQTTSKIIINHQSSKCKRSNELDAKIKRVNEAYQKLMKPVAVTKLDKAFKDAARSFEVSITNGQDPLMQP